MAKVLWYWAPLLVPGIFQTEAYARAILGADPDSGEDLDDLVYGRLERQQILSRPKPPTVTVILDEAVLHRCIGSPKVMHDQLLHLADVSERLRIYIHVIPAEIGTHAGPSEGTVRVISLGICLVAVATSRYLRATATQAATRAVTGCRSGGAHSSSPPSSATEGRNLPAGRAMSRDWCGRRILTGPDNLNDT